MYVAISSALSWSALTERRCLLEAAGIQHCIAAASPSEAVAKLRGVPHASAIYILDLNSVTVPVAAWARASGRRVVVDLGDDAYGLARASGRPLHIAASRGLFERAARLGVPVVYRGRLHPIFRNLGARRIWCPDTVPDWLLDRDYPPGDPCTVATFGSMKSPGSDGWTYGMEVLRALEVDPNLKGIVVGRGPGLEVFRAAAARVELKHRLTVCGEMPLEGLVDVVCRAAYVTSFQTNDVAGWVRTTGKLPIALASRRVLLSTPVGEAALVLPRSWLIEPDRRAAGAEVAARIAKLRSLGLPFGDGSLATPYRRSLVARKLAAFLSEVAE